MADFSPLNFVVPGLGAIASGVAQHYENKRNRRRAEDIESLRDKSDAEYASLARDWAPYVDAAMRDYGAFQNASARYRDEAGTYAPTREFQNDIVQETRNLWDPFFEQKVKGATLAAGGAMASQGALDSSAGLGAINRAYQQMYDQSYGSALQGALANQGQKYGWFSDQIARERAKVDQWNQMLQQNIAQLGQTAQFSRGGAENYSAVEAQKIANYNALEQARIAQLQGVVNPWQAGMESLGNSFGQFTNSLTGGGGGTPFQPTRGQ